MPSEDGKKGSIIIKKKNCGKFEEVIFGAGTPFDDFARPAPFWTGTVAYRWNPVEKVFHVYSVQVLGTGTVINKREYETEKNSCDEINDFLDYLKELEEHYIKEYGE